MFYNHECVTMKNGGAERCFTHLEVMSGRINIFNILISSSPGKEK